MSKVALPVWAGKPKLNVRPAVNAQPVNAQSTEPPVNAQPAKRRSGSKHPPGYMTEYMRKRRAK